VGSLARDLGAGRPQLNRAQAQALRRTGRWVDDRRLRRGEHLESVTGLRFLRAAPVALLVSAAALWAVPSAGAAFTSSQVSAPANPSFGMYDEEVAPTFAATGSVTGGAGIGEELDLRCYYGSVSEILVPNVVVELDGSFSAPVTPVNSTTCRLRAVPAGTEPTELAGFTGPILAVGESRVILTEGSPSVPFDFYANGQQLTAADDYVSISDCGLADSYLRDEEFEEHSTFFCNDFYEDFNNSGQPLESGFRVDGANAYFSTAAFGINAEANGFPQLAYDFAQDPSNGNLTIHDREPAVVCPDPTYPPNAASCEEFLASGVRDERTIEQTHDGHLVLITDSFHSTDGKAHQVEALPENEQDFNRHGEEIEYKFPGEPGYVPRVEGETVSFPDSATGAVYIKVTGAADGDTETGRGAIVFFQPSSPAYFNDFRERRNSFFFANTATVPPTGTATIKYAYAQAFTQAEVEALVADAVPPGPPAPVVKSTTGPGSPTATFRIRKVQHFKATGTLKMRVEVTGPGQLSLAGKRVKSVSQRIARKGTVYLAVAPTTALKELMEEHGVAQVTVKVKFTPNSGPDRVKVKKMRLVLNS
jgi:hypothetical protein